ncbi:S41 family peptidase [Streptomyces sp. NPDC090022]|uniref:S41 family peptidase n=1 Tax=Streptomyces sp. NPDC090022 TaxID=3365920 RepID=UPI003815A7AC
MPNPTDLQPARIIDELARLVADHYVFPDVGLDLAAMLRRRLAEGAYDVPAAEELGRLVTADLQARCGDRHLRLTYHPDQVPSGQGEAVAAQMRREYDASLGGVPRLELLEDGVAVLELAPYLFPLEWAAEPVGAALSLASRARALVLDLRRDLGGSPDTVAFVCGHLLDERTHLNTMHWREGDRREQSWSPPYVPGPRFGGRKPVYVLTSDRTFSAAEELAYDLQQLGRAVVVGEVTGGGAHPREGWTLHPHLEATIPVGRAVNPVSGTNWEGTGVRPDVPCAAADALDHALGLARAAVADALTAARA